MNCNSPDQLIDNSPNKRRLTDNSKNIVKKHSGKERTILFDFCDQTEFCFNEEQLEFPMDEIEVQYIKEEVPKDVKEQNVLELIHYQESDQEEETDEHLNLYDIPIK